MELLDMTPYKLFGLILILTNLSFHSVHSANILITFTSFSESHKKSIVPLAERLGKRGHNVVMWHVGLSKFGSSAKNYKELESIGKLEIPWMNDFFLHGNSSELRAVMKQPELWFGDFEKFYGVDAEICRHVLQQNPEHRRFVETQHWDLMIVDNLFNVCGIYFSKLKATPTISLSTTIFFDNTVFGRNIPVNFASYPTLEVSSYDHLSFYWRLLTVPLKVGRMVLFRLGDRTMQKLMMTADEDIGGQLSLFDLERQSIATASMVPQILDFPKVHSPDLHYYGYTCKDFVLPAKSKHEIPKEILDFIEDPESKGTIVAGFGHWVRWSVMPKHVTDSFVGMFRLMADYRFIFQYNGPELKNLPSNVYVSKWMPQKELLAHEKTKVFISHCGMKSIVESICNKVPVLSFPLYYEQPRNALMVTGYLGVGLNVVKNKVTPQLLANAVKRVAEDLRFKERVDKLATYLDDVILEANEEVMFRIEHVLRRKDDYASLFQLKSRHLSFFVYYSLDSLMFLFCLLCMPFIVAIVLLRRR